MPDWKSEIRQRLATVRLEPAREATIVEELAAHLDDFYAELLSSAATEAEAYQRTLAELSGNALLARELRRVERRINQEPIVPGINRRRHMIADLWQDLRFGVRMLAKQRGFSLIAVLTLALGIGANTVIFSVVNAVLLRPLPLPEPDRLVTFWHSAPSRGPGELNLNDALFALYRDRSHTFEKMAAYEPTGGVVSAASDPEVLTGARVTFNYFDVLGQEPLLGRSFLPSEDTPRGQHKVVIISYGLWQRRFGGDPAIVGQSFKFNNVPTVVVGVMPSGFDFPNQAERGLPDHVQFWVPLQLDPQNNHHWEYSAIGRLKPGLTTADAERELMALWGDYEKQHHSEGGGSLGPGATTIVMPLSQRIVRGVRTPLLILLGAVALVLLIACANIANLLLARATARSREIATRCCLGASARRIARQLLTESLLLAVMGAGSGLLLAAWGVDALKRSSLAQVPRLELVRLDSTVLLFTIGVTLLTGVLFGLAPALWSTRVNLQEAIKEGSRGTSGSSRRLNNAFVIAQLALSLVLLIGAALLLESFKNLLAVNPGFKAENLLTGRVALDKRYSGSVSGFYDRLLEGVRRLPGIESAELCQSLPFSGVSVGAPFNVEGREPKPGEPTQHSWYRSITPGYFATMGIPILKGRPFQDSDTESSLPVAIVDEKLVSSYWPNEDPIGKRVRIGRPWMTIVGVARSVKNANLNEDTKPYVYQPFSQSSRAVTFIVIRTAKDPEALISSVRAQVSALDPEVPLFQVMTMEHAVSTSLVTQRLTNLLLAGFAVTALLLAMIGIYGVMSLSVSNRTNEFGIRLALGAQPRDVLRLVVKQAVVLTLSGIAIGLVAAFALTRWLESLLFNVSTTDPITFAGVTLLLTLVALLASYIPARRATNVDPITALRNE